ncbi:AAA family ATPase [Syntrophobacter fumaroxidans]|uniref:Peptidoglycan-binding LysM n=1 Tax=Syntrophobacter fumaroxidans (strain DSM 10017 / MPOB) TaxID=335543 RepID=A0LIE0_SYNFM|nr:AAA family ATPase [Syntrophobacter fumaroxidans]ABK17192.1 Peptidoglycan-binding LysM [Syntrophobacter fumaroxidans MPOB]
MYRSYFGFAFSPFDGTRDRRFFFAAEEHAEITSALLCFVEQRKSFALVRGDAGTGKTKILQHLLGKLPDSVHPILVPYPDVEYIEILRYIARTLGVDPKWKEDYELLNDIRKGLTEGHAQGRQFVLIIDEAHRLSLGCLENIRLLSNIETNKCALLQILFIGHDEICRKLNRREMRQLRQRISINRYIPPLTASETKGYVDHRLKVAGSGFDECFEGGVAETIHRMTGGVPRNINELCHVALRMCSIQKLRKVNKRVLRQACKAVHGNVGPVPERAGAAFGRNLRMGLLGGALAVAVGLFVAEYPHDLRKIGGEWIHSLYRVTSSDSPSERASLPVAPPGHMKTARIPAGPQEIAPDPAPSAPNEPRSPSPSPSSLVTEPLDESPEKGSASPMPGKEAPSPAAASSAPETGPNVAQDPQAPGVGRESDTDQESGQVQGTAAADGSGNSAPGPANSKPEGSTVEFSETFEVVVKRGETLSRIAAQWFPEDPKLGEKLIIRANPKLGDKHRIRAGQALKIPRTSRIDAGSPRAGYPPPCSSLSA